MATLSNETVRADASMSADVDGAYAVEDADATLAIPAPAPRTRDRYFLDDHGRALLFRGVNVAGNAKLPASPDIPSYRVDHFWDPVGGMSGVSFVGRPFPLADAHAHCARLRDWGMSLLRLCVTWEAVEHFGPGIYDVAYVEYIVAVVKVAREYGLTCFLDPHQDVWARHCGGSGAPAWTLAVAGLDASKLDAAGAAITHAGWLKAQGDSTDPAAYPKMIWATNYAKLATATMFTLFFGGKTYAPRLHVPDYPRGDTIGNTTVVDDSVRFSIQDVLQTHFISAMQFLARAVHAANLDAGTLPPVLGWDSLNEPNPGFIGVPDLDRAMPSQMLKNGAAPTPVQGMRAGLGMPQKVAQYRIAWCGPIWNGSTTINKDGVLAWLPTRADLGDLHRAGLDVARAQGARVHVNTTPLVHVAEPLTAPPPALGEADSTCIWAAHGVWDPATGTLLRPDYFANLPGAPDTVIDPEEFMDRFWLPFVDRFVGALRAVSPNAYVFLDPPVNEAPPDIHARRSRRATAPNDPGMPGAHDHHARARSVSPTKPHVRAVTNDTTASMDAVTEVLDTAAIWRPHDRTASNGSTSSAIDDRLVYAPHWYDGLTLITKHQWPYNVDFLHIQRGLKSWLTGLRIGYPSVRRGMAAQMALVRDESRARLGPDVPVIIGEIGIPFDMDVGGEERSRATAMHRALDANLAALDAALLHATVWNYTPGTHKVLGDHWNGEDLSVLAPDGESPRPRRALLRPYPRASPGTPRRLWFDMRRAAVEYVVDVDGGTVELEEGAVSKDPETWDRRHVVEMYWPNAHFPDRTRCKVAVSRGTVAVDFARQRLWWHVGAGAAGKCTLQAWGDAVGTWASSEDVMAEKATVEAGWWLPPDDPDAPVLVDNMERATTRSSRGRVLQNVREFFGWDE
ncbi:hypothetical protein GGF32_005535 [Allomyces javanicus]|nr:hypothetical protein GGF32_005535 [Allomyces javanicus]